MGEIELIVERRDEQASVETTSCLIAECNCGFDGCDEVTYD